VWVFFGWVFLGGCTQETHRIFFGYVPTTRVSEPCQISIQSESILTVAENIPDLSKPLVAGLAWL